MLSSVLPCLRNFHPTTKPPSSVGPVSIVDAALHGLFPLSYDVPDTDIVPTLSVPFYLSHCHPFFSFRLSYPLHASSTSTSPPYPIPVVLSRPRHFPSSRSAFQFIPFAGSYFSFYLVSSEILNRSSVPLIRLRNVRRALSRSPGLLSLIIDCCVNRRPNHDYCLMERNISLYRRWPTASVFWERLAKGQSDTVRSSVKWTG